MVSTDPNICPECGSDVTRMTVETSALLRGGGYGATKRTVADFCTQCDWMLNRVVEEVKPS